MTSCTDTTVVQSNVTPPRHRILQNHRLIWLDANIDQANEFYHDAIIQLQTIVNDVETFTDPDQCVDHLTDIIHEKVFMVISKATSEQIVPFIHDATELDTIYLFLNHESEGEGNLFQDWPKVKGEYTEITSICEAIKKAVKRCDQNIIPISFVTTDEGTSDTNLDELDSSFMYTQILKEILLVGEYNPQAIKDFVLYLQDQNMVANCKLKSLDEFERKYKPESSIQWYTSQGFIYEVLNRALRNLEADIMLKMGFFIQNLHHQLEKLYTEQFRNIDAMPFIVHRGQGLSKKEFEQLLKTKGGLMSFNNFLSTSEDRDVSLNFAKDTLINSELIGILFKIAIDPKICSSPYAHISKFSSFEEEKEVLFSMHSVFRIVEIERIDNNDRLYEVELKLTADDDQQLRTLTTRIREETYPAAKEWYRISMFLTKVGQFQQAEDVCMAAQIDTHDDAEKPHFYCMLGRIKNAQGDYEKAVFYYEKVVEILEKTHEPNDRYLATAYNNIASVYHNTGDYSKALSFFEKALEIGQQVHPTDYSLLACFYNNVASIYIETGEYLKAVSYFEQALKIYEDHLPPNHPDLATSYSNNGCACVTIEEYSKALIFLEKALGIKQRILSANHPDLAVTYYNIAVIYSEMAEYSKGISYLEKALEIQEKVLSANHPHLAESYCTIAETYKRLRDYSKALEFHEKALKIKQAALPPSHPNLAKSYGHIGMIYNTLAEYSKALSYQGKALEIIQMVLSPTRLLADIYDNIGSVYADMKQYKEARSFCKKALKIRQQTLPEKYSRLAYSLNNVGTLYCNMGKHSKALLYFDKAEEILKKTFKSNHPLLALVYRNIGDTYAGIGEYSKALGYYEKALDILQQTPENDPSLLYLYGNIAVVNLQLKNYSTALSFSERALQIGQKYLAVNDPDLIDLKNNHAAIIRTIVNNV